MKSQGGCRCGLSKSDDFVSVGNLLTLFGLFDYRARPEFCVCEPWGSLSELCVCEPWVSLSLSLSLSLSCFLLHHPRGCWTTDSTRTKHSRYSTVCLSTKLFDCVSTLTDAVGPTGWLACNVYDMMVVGAFAHTSSPPYSPAELNRLHI